MKLLYLVLRQVAREWKCRRVNCARRKLEFAIMFDERVVTSVMVNQAPHTKFLTLPYVTFAKAVGYIWGHVLVRRLGLHPNHRLDNCASSLAAVKGSFAVPLRLWGPVVLQEHPDRLLNCVLGRDR